MNILMLAPEPFFQPRGTPISVYFRIKALSNLGHKVDLITYPLGEDVHFKNLSILRVPNLLCIRKIKIGPSLTKIPLDFLLLLRAVFRMTKKRYDLIFSHEEAAWLGVILAKIRRLPHVYDMHSSLPQQLENFNFSRSILLKEIFSRVERYILKNSSAVIVICLDLLKKVKKEGFETKAILIENFLDFDNQNFSEEQKQKKRREYAPVEEKIILYAGNLQPYQGISLLLEAAAKMKDEKVVFLLVGGERVNRAAMKRKAENLNISDKVIFAGEVPPSQIQLFISLADVLVSPRLSGTNTPLKIYSYLKSKKPLVATNLWTHTQVLSSINSILTEPNPQSLADGILYALFNEDAQKRARTANEFAEKEYTYPKYQEKINQTLKKACTIHRTS